MEMVMKSTFYRDRNRNGSHCRGIGNVEKIRLKIPIAIRFQVQMNF